MQHKYSKDIAKDHASQNQSDAAKQEQPPGTQLRKMLVGPARRRSDKRWICLTQKYSAISMFTATCRIVGGHNDRGKYFGSQPLSATLFSASLRLRRRRNPLCRHRPRGRFVGHSTRYRGLLTRLEIGG